jgi:hypothetical protein
MSEFRHTWILAVAVLASCGGRTALEHDDGTSPAVVRADAGLPPCKGGLTQCGQRNVSLCYDLSRSQDHCGACGHACPLGIACKAGVCQQARCQGPLTFKSLAEVNTNSPELSAPYRPVLGDFDGDGILDLAGVPEITDAGGVLTGALMFTGVKLVYGAGDGTFPTARRIESSKIQGWKYVSADLDGDGVLDLVGTHENLSGVSVNRGSGTRSAPVGQTTTYPTSQTPDSVVVADFNSDGVPDLVAAVAAKFEIWRGQGKGGFEHRATLPTHLDIKVVQAVDLNRDGALDLVYGSPNLHLRLGRGDGTFDPDMVCGLALSSPTVAPLHVMADLDNDGVIDMVGRSAVLLGLDQCNAQRIVSVDSWESQPAEPVEIADLNGDGNLDVLARYGMYLGDGKGGFAQPDWPLMGNAAFLVGDVNRDGKLDVITVDQEGWQVLLNTCP